MGGVNPAARRPPVVFLGPTLPVAEAARILAADYRPPAELGSVYRAARERPAAIGIVDGYFERVPAVWHKEILYALSLGVRVYGAASMGALRAAELAEFGMIPVGEVAEQYRRGVLTDDDEVAVLHAPTQGGYRPLSEPMVNIRATLAAAVRETVVGEEVAAALAALAKDMFYPDREWGALLDRAGADDPAAAAQLARLRAWLPSGAVDQKRLDAERLLAEMGRWIESGGGPPQVAPFPFEQTENWRELVVGDAGTAARTGDARPGTDAGGVVERRSARGGRGREESGVVNGDGRPGIRERSGTGAPQPPEPTTGSTSEHTAERTDGHTAGRTAERTAGRTAERTDGRTADWRRLRAGEVPRRRADDIGGVRELEQARRPLLIEGALDRWPALDRWNPGYLREKVGRTRVPVEFYPSGSYYGSWVQAQLRMDRYLDLLTSPGEAERCYLAQVPLLDLLPELADDLSVPGCLAGAPELGLALFVGRDTVTALHYHSNEQALLCQVSGAKEVLLFPPSDHRHLQHHPWYSYRFNFSRIDFSAVPAGPNSPLRHTTPLRCTVRAGEALYIPLYWGHLVEGPGITSSVTFFWRPTAGRTWWPPAMRLRAAVGGAVRRRLVSPVGDALSRRFGLGG
ncbi:TfuA-like protein [Nonomuraea sp. NPDC047897]|uniref:TfuA-like protein n=1 Tax=Nonomuraea sp. NPDC047897 TaxID=3364346 RepID=UPI0037245331